jgi:hypothetical protein
VIDGVMCRIAEKGVVTDAASWLYIQPISTNSLIIGLDDFLKQQVNFRVKSFLFFRLCFHSFMILFRVFSLSVVLILPSGIETWHL